MIDRFAALREMLKAIPPERMAELKAAHLDFIRLKSLCSAKGYIEVKKNLTGIKVLKNSKEVEELKNVLIFLKPGGFTWQEVGGTEKSLNESSDEN